MNVLRIKVNRHKTPVCFQAIRDLVMEYIKLYDLIPQEIWLYEPDFRELKLMTVNSESNVIQFMGVPIKPFSPNFSLDSDVCPFCGGKI